MLFMFLLFLLFHIIIVCQELSSILCLCATFIHVSVGVLLLFLFHIILFTVHCSCSCSFVVVPWLYQLLYIRSGSKVFVLTILLFLFLFPILSLFIYTVRSSYYYFIERNWCGTRLSILSGSIPKSVVYTAILLCHLPPEEYHPTAERSTSSHTVAVFGMMVLVCMYRWIQCR